jgi:hypothetical protein
MQIPPAAVRASWPKPNYVDPITRGNENVIINYVLFSFLVGFIAIRVFTRTHLRRAFGADDVFILLATASTSLLRILAYKISILSVCFSNGKVEECLLWMESVAGSLNLAIELHDTKEVKAAVR